MKKGETVLVPLAEGFEEIEAITIVDVLRRADLSVTVAGLREGPVEGAHGITVQTDCALADVDPGTIGMIVLPGGMPGTRHLNEDARLRALLTDLHAKGQPLAAICAAPMVLADAGVLGTRPATSHPSVRDKLGEAEVVATPRVVRSGHVTTSQGPGTALEFSLAIVAELAGEAKARQLAEAMLVATGTPV